MQRRAIQHPGPAATQRVDALPVHVRQVDLVLQPGQTLLLALVQSLPEYRDQTTFILATDHGRGPAPVAWKNHGKAISESASIWIGLLGPDSPALGERSNTPEGTQGQVAATVAGHFGLDFNGPHPKAAKPLIESYKQP